MELDSGILISAIVAMGGVVACLWKQITSDSSADKVSLHDCISRERELLKKLAKMEDNGN